MPFPKNFNPQGFRKPRRITVSCSQKKKHFNPQGFRKPRPYPLRIDENVINISIHKAFASLDLIQLNNTLIRPTFQSTRLSQASTSVSGCARLPNSISIHKAFASLDRVLRNGLHNISLFQSTRLSQASTT